MVEQRTRMFGGKQYSFRNAFPKKIALEVARELRGRGVLVKLTKESDDEWMDTAIWYRIKKGE